MNEFEKEVEGFQQGRISQDTFFLAFEDAYRARILSYLLTQTADPNQIEDIYQEFCLRVLKSVHSYVLGMNFDAWLFRLARNSAINYALSKAGQNIASEEISPDVRAPEPGPKTENIKKEIEALVNQGLDGLPKEYREIIFLKLYADLTYKEICAITGFPTSTIQTRLEKGMDLLGSAIQNLSPKQDD